MNRIFPVLTSAYVMRSWQGLRLTIQVQELDASLKKLGHANAAREFISACKGAMTDGGEQMIKGGRVETAAWRFPMGSQGHVMLMVQKAADGRFYANIRKFGAVRRKDARTVINELIPLISKTMLIAA